MAFDLSGSMRIFPGRSGRAPNARSHRFYGVPAARGAGPGMGLEMFAVIRTGGKQYRVAADDVLTIERLEGEAGSAIVFEDVLALDAGDGLKVGAPLVSGAKVTASIVAQTRGPQLIVFKKKRRQHYRRKNGHRQDLTQVKIESIQA